MISSPDAVSAAIDAAIDGARDSLIRLCGALVAAPSVNPPGRTAGVAAVVKSWLDAQGVLAEIVAADDAAPNVVGRVGGAAGGRHVVFNAHMDTMEPGDERAWTAPIYEMSRRDGRLYGLGMGNMKGALAAMCMATAMIRRHAPDSAGRLTMTAVSDEVMFGERGAVHLLRGEPGLAGDVLISGEGPGYMGLAVAEKGLLWLDVEATGTGGHSSGARARETAVMRLAAFLARLDPLNDLYAPLPPELAGVSGGEGDLGRRLSLNAGALAAGTVRSQIARSATAELDIRLPPGLGADEIEARIRALALGDPHIRITRTKAWDANWTALADPLVTAIAAAAEAVRGAAPQRVIRLPGSDARRWRERGVPAVCYGPQPTLSAGVDDYACEQDVVDCAKIYARTALALMNL